MKLARLDMASDDWPERDTVVEVPKKNQSGGSATTEGNCTTAAMTEGVMWFVPETGTLLHVNDGWRHLYGDELPSLDDLTLSRFVIDPAQMQTLIDQALHVGSSERVSTQLRRFDGQHIDVTMCVERVLLAAQTVLFATVWAPARAERDGDALLRYEARFRALIEKLPDGIIVHRNARIIYANHAANALLGYEEQTLVGRSALDLVHPPDREAMSERMRQMLSRGAASPVAEERLVHREGRIVNVDATDIIVEFDGRPALLTIVRDITEKKRMEAQLLMADRLAALGRLSASIGHEINNPLAYMLGNAQLLQRDLESAREALPASRYEAMRTKLDVLQEGGGRVRDIVRDLKSLSAADREDFGPVDIHRVIDVCANMAEHEIRHRARLVRDYGPRAYVRSSEAKLGQVFLNLLINAGQAIGEGDSASNEIRVSSRMLSDREVELSISDTGAGIPPTLLGRIFEPFFTTKSGEGTGLGLSICQHVVDSLGGRISVEPNEPRGSRFIVVLPTCHDQYARTSAPPSPVRSTRPMIVGRPKVLVVDDEPHIAEVLRQELAEMDVAVRTGGHAAAELLSRFDDFDAILLDVLMDDFGGAELYETLRQRPGSLERRIVFMTGGAVPPKAQVLLGRVRNPCLQKPFSPDALRRALNTVMPPRHA